MKRENSYFILIFFLLTALSACRKSDLFNKYARYMSCKIDGESWTPRFTINLEIIVFACPRKISNRYTLLQSE